MSESVLTTWVLMMQRPNTITWKEYAIQNRKSILRNKILLSFFKQNIKVAVWGGTMVMIAYVCRTFRTMTFVFIRCVQILCTQYSSPTNHQFVLCLYCYWRWSASASVALNHVRYITEAFICKCGRTRYFVQGLSVLEEDLKDLRLHTDTQVQYIQPHWCGGQVSADGCWH